MISLKSKGFSLRPAARRLLGLKRHSPKFCNQLARREAINWNYFYYYKNPTTQNGIIWCKVPKAGSTTLTKMFLRLAGSKNYKNNTRVHKLLRDFYPRIPNKLMLDKMKTTKSFLVVRDPFERILSAYRDKLESYNRDLVYRDGFYHETYGRFMVQQPHSKQTNLSSNGNATASIRKEPTWNEFIAYLLKTPVSRYDEHWMPITKLCSPCNVQFDYIIKMENFEKEIQKPLKDADIKYWQIPHNWKCK
ncbi:Carbohydrate sulfotransferase 8 [Orchesella cincta]|uniref:Carbohydrate sulfotransferase n=1 Tax=Orchesella cincta TaxID=48709 RepID=A0A1D2MUX3_ORCCI|nr:Carbohydrate sulfotransferase 8 [Orchesella cincta]